MNKRIWAFYYVLNKDRVNEFVIGTCECKRPTQTKIYKRLQEYWNNEGVTAVGYTTELNRISLVWPQGLQPS